VGDWRNGSRRVEGALPFPPLSTEDLGAVAAHVARVTRRWIVIFAADGQIEHWREALRAADAPVVRLGVALRTNPRPQMTGDRPATPADWLVIAHRPGAMRWNGGGRAACWPSAPARHDPGGQVHPTQKPISLVRALVEDFTDVGELILDPFAGSGTTAVASKELGRRFVGCERDPGYHVMALRRIEAAREQLRLAGPTWSQERLLG
jgi:hypothetical protein